jgi:hypothetical protein
MAAFAHFLQKQNPLKFVDFTPDYFFRSPCARIRQKENENTVCRSQTGDPTHWFGHAAGRNKTLLLFTADSCKISWPIRPPLHATGGKRWHRQRDWRLFREREVTLKSYSTLFSWQRCKMRSCLCCVYQADATDASAIITVIAKVRVLGFNLSQIFEQLCYKA